jgi:acyl CoA:acetate/3-ketoacid CoA transferase beta subunit
VARHVAPRGGQVSASRAETCAAACADLFAADGEILASPMGLLPRLGAQLARLTTNPDLLLTDGEAHLVDPSGTREGWLPYRAVFDVVAYGRRHVVMGANQLDRYGNQNISCLGPHERPTRQMFGARGAPGNTINHRTSYWVGKHSPRVFAETVDFVSGVGYDRAVGPFHDVHRVVTNLAVLDFGGPGHTMRIVSLHPGVTVADVRAATSFELAVEEVGTTREPTGEELRLLLEVLDPQGARDREVSG